MQNAISNFETFNGNAVSLKRPVRFRSTSQLLYKPLLNIDCSDFEIGTVVVDEKQMKADILLHRKLPGGGTIQRLTHSIKNMIYLTPRDLILSVRPVYFDHRGYVLGLTYHVSRKPFADYENTKIYPVKDKDSLEAVKMIMKDLVQNLENERQNPTRAMPVD